MKLKLNGAKDIKLPKELDCQQRLELSKKIILDNPRSFEITGYAVTDNKVIIRLDILGTYILNSVKDIRETVLSRYKEKRRPHQEKAFSNLLKHQEINIIEKIYSQRKIS